MKKATLKLTAVVMLLAAVSTNSIAQSTSNDISVVTTAVPFLRISPDARSGGMGDVGIATSADAYSGFWNLGKVPFGASKTIIGATYTPWLTDLGLNDVYLASLAGYHQFDDVQAITFGVRYFSLGSIQFTDANGNQLNTFRPREFSIDAGYTRKLSGKSGLGIGLHYISSDLAGGTVNGVSYKKGTSFAGDIHYFHNGLKENGAGFNWGITVSNLGSKISYTEDASQEDFIPANLGIGGTYTTVFDADNKMSFSGDFNKLLVPTPPSATDSAGLAEYRDESVASSWFSSFGEGDELTEVTAALGIEYTYKDQFSVRTGYFYENPDKGNRQYFTFGAGLKYSQFGLDFSYLLPSGSGVNRNPLSNTLRFTVSFNFDKKK